MPASKYKEKLVWNLMPNPYQKEKDWYRDKIKSLKKKEGKMDDNAKEKLKTYKKKLRELTVSRTTGWIDKNKLNKPYIDDFVKNPSGGEETLKMLNWDVGSKRFNKLNNYLKSRKK